MKYRNNLIVCEGKSIICYILHELFEKIFLILDCFKGSFPMDVLYVYHLKTSGMASKANYPGWATTIQKQPKGPESSGSFYS